MSSEQSGIKLTEYSKGAGCGCKISPKILQQILSDATVRPGGNLLVGNDHQDDAAVYDLQNGTALIATTDFFTPVVDDAFSFGSIAAANAISDVYAMGGRPVVAIAILGWPEKIPASEAQKVLAGARQTCAEVGISIAGGHSIDSSEPFFGLAVNGIVPLSNLKKNNTASEGDFLFLTKPIGVGILSTAQKRKMTTSEEAAFMIAELRKLNSAGEHFGKIEKVTAMTDVTGFGLAGHLLEMTQTNGLSVSLQYDRIPVYEPAKKYLQQRIIPDATFRNWQSYSDQIHFEKGVNVMEAFSLLPDPQTNGGLLIAVSPSGVERVKSLLGDQGLSLFSEPVGRFVPKGQKTILVE